MDILKALVIVVIAYTSATMIMAANKNKKTAQLKTTQCLLNITANNKDYKLL